MELAATREQLRSAKREVLELREALGSASAREKLLGYEIQHRVRNLLGVIRSIYRRSRESGASQDEFAEHFEGRLNAVARYQAVVTGLDPDGFDLEVMVRDVLLEVPCLDGPRLTVAGPRVCLRQATAELMGLAIHELTTNAIKFGALDEDGNLRVEWSLYGPPEQQILHFRWSEDGGVPLTTAPRPRGFGQELIEDALPYQLGATTLFELRPGGVECTIDLPLPSSDPVPRSGDDSDDADEEESFLHSEQGRRP